MFEIKTEEGSLNVTTEELFQLILKQCFVEEHNENLKDIDAFIKVITKTVKTNLLEANLTQLFSIYFMAGYYYKIFLNQNEVIINNKDKKEK
tara:strand:+ start:8306 stop:8581 length:276 start_codon:yes stop_codon:yes gene_type:complete